MATISITREELLEKLLAAKAKADREDAKAAAAHEAKEQAALRKFRAELRAAMKWDWKTAKRKYGRVEFESPSCPARHARHIELAIAQVKMDSRKGRFHLSDQSDWYRAASWLPDSERPKASVCD
jgi:hypothetical protein